MSKGNKQTKISQFIRGFCKNRTEEELIEAEEIFNEYLLIVKEIFDRMEHEENELVDFEKHD